MSARAVEPMSAHASTSVDARLARLLLVEAARSLPLLDAGARDIGLDAIDAFVAAPAPPSWLRAVRVLRELGRAARGDAHVRALAARSFARGLERVRALPALADAAAVLAALPLDARAGRRLDALAALVTAHQELASRVREADAARRPLPADAFAVEPRATRERRRRR